MRKLIFFALLLLFLTACTPKVHDFDSALAAIERLDEKYDASFREENIPDLMADIDDISQYINELRLINETIDFSTDDGKHASFLVQARMEMLEAQRFFQLARDIGPRGFVLPNFTCNDVPYIEKASSHLAQTGVHALRAYFFLDELLVQYPKSQDVIGIDETRFPFYRSKLSDISFERRRNLQSIEKYCNYTG